MANEVRFCPACQARLENERECWLCHHRLTNAELANPVSPYAGSLDSVVDAESGHSPNPYAPPPPVSESGLAVSIEWILIGGLIVVLGFLTAIAPGLGILLFIVIAPALIRTAVVVARKQRHGADVSVGEKSIMFFASMAAVVTACAAAGAAFAVTCVATCFGALFISSTTRNLQMRDSVFGTMIIVSAIVGLGFGGMTLYLFWGRKKDARTS